MSSTSAWWRRFPILVAVVVAQFGATPPAFAQQPRVLGIDVSAYQSDKLNFSTLYGANNRKFAVIRSSRGGTTGEDHRQGGYPAGDNTYFNLSERYDDPYYIHNINSATKAGMFAGSYHFSRPDVIASTPNSGGIPNNGTDEAAHFIQMAGPWMRPGYLMPVHDFEAGDGVRTDNEMAQFCIDFSNKIYNDMGIRPAIYVNGNYASFVIGGASQSLRDQVVAAYPTLWSARWPNQADPNSILVQTAHPKDSYTPIYGPWDDSGVTHPWTFWQYASTARLSGYNSGNSNIDVDVAQGGIEFLKDQLIPALWMNDNSGQWTDLLNWNSGQTAIMPVRPAGQLANYAGDLTLPTARLPGVDDTAAGVSGLNDTVILDRPNANITVTLSSGTHNIRKLYVREALNITGGSLTINYDNGKYADNDPLRDLASSNISAQFSGAVSLSGSGSLSVYRLQVDATRTFTLAGSTGALTFDTIDLMRHSSTPAKIAMTGDANINPLSNATATIQQGGTSGSTGFIDLSGGARTFNVGNGSSSVDLSVDVPITNGALTKNGLGTMRLGATNTYTGQTTVNGGILLVTANGQLGSTGAVTGQAGTLQLSGNVNYALPLTVGGPGASGASVTAPGNPGALDSLSGNNIWSGAITLAGTGTNGTDPLINQIGAQAGTLRTSGVIQDASGVTATWAKTGDGDVILSGSNANTYSGLTRLFGGRLIVEKDGALGTAGSGAGTTGNTFQLSGSASTLAFRNPGGAGGVNYNTFEVINTHGTGAPGLGQVDNLGGNNTFAGQIAFDGPTASGARQGSIGVSSGSLHVTGGLFSRGNDGTPRHITKLGAGTLILSGDGAVVTGNPLVVPLASSTFSIDAGTVELRGPTATTTNLPGVTTWNVGSGGTLNAASGRFSTDIVNVNAGGQFKLTGGSLSVNAIQGNLTNESGMLTPGNSAGSTAIVGNYTQQSGGELEIQIGGTAQGTGYDFVTVSGNATLDGVLRLALIDGFAPIPAQTFTVFSAGSLLGSLSNVGNGQRLNTFDGLGSFLVNYGASSAFDPDQIVLSSFVPTHPYGDYNDDGMVDAADYVVWRHAAPADNLPNDPTAGTAESDYGVWVNNFGSSAESGSGGLGGGAAPEPTSVALMGIAWGLLHLLGSRRRRPGDSAPQR